MKYLLAGSMLVGFGSAVMAEDFDGPTAGPKAAEGKTIVVLAADMKNGGILGVTTGIEEAAKKIGWTVKVLDGAGSVQSRAAAVGQALALKPDGIVINGFDAAEQQAALEGDRDSRQDPNGVLALRPQDRLRCSRRHFRQRLNRRHGRVQEGS